MTVWGWHRRSGAVAAAGTVAIVANVVVVVVVAGVVTLVRVGSTTQIAREKSLRSGRGKFNALVCASRCVCGSGRWHYYSPLFQFPFVLLPCLPHMDMFNCVSYCYPEWHAHTSQAQRHLTKNCPWHRFFLPMIICRVRRYLKKRQENYVRDASIIKGCSYTYLVVQLYLFNTRLYPSGSLGLFGLQVALACISSTLPRCRLHSRILYGHSRSTHPAASKNWLIYEK